MTEQQSNAVLVDVDGPYGRVRVLRDETGFSVEVREQVRHDGLSAEEAISALALHLTTMTTSEGLTRTAFGHTPAN
jgi:hypothetical protein